MKKLNLIPVLFIIFCLSSGVSCTKTSSESVLEEEEEQEEVPDLPVFRGEYESDTLFYREPAVMHTSTGIITDQEVIKEYLIRKDFNWLFSFHPYLGEGYTLDESLTITFDSTNNFHLVMRGSSTLDTISQIRSVDDEKVVLQLSKADSVQLDALSSCVEKVRLTFEIFDYDSCTSSIGGKQFCDFTELLPLYIKGNDLELVSNNSVFSTSDFCVAGNLQRSNVNPGLRTLMRNIDTAVTQRTTVKLIRKK